MAKARKKRKVSRARAAGSGFTAMDKSGASSSKPLIYGLIALAVLAGGAWFAYDWWRVSGAEEPFQALVPKGRAALAMVQTLPGLPGNNHLGPGQALDYGTAFPIAGPHSRVPTDPGYYDGPQPAVEVVHALEHGHIVIYKDQPGAAAEDNLKAWARLFRGQWSGVVVLSREGLGKALVLTAWKKRLDLDAFDAATTAAFIDAYRGRGPENPVR